MQAPDRQAVRNAADQIDRLLRTDPERRGIPVRGKWVLVEPPLVVVYDIHPDDRLVEVLGVGRAKP
jgi:hypothetical protein